MTRANAMQIASVFLSFLGVRSSRCWILVVSRSTIVKVASGSYSPSCIRSARRDLLIASRMRSRFFAIVRLLLSLIRDPGGDPGLSGGFRRYYRLKEGEKESAKALVVKEFFG